jgi:hypothetical protein
MPEKYKVEWTPSTARSIGEILPSKPELENFETEWEAVSYVMSKLDERFRGTAKLNYPDGRIYELPMIAVRYAYLQKERGG